MFVCTVSLASAILFRQHLDVTKCYGNETVISTLKFLRVTLQTELIGNILGLYYPTQPHPQLIEHVVYQLLYQIITY